MTKHTCATPSRRPRIPRYRSCCRHWGGVRGPPHERRSVPPAGWPRGDGGDAGGRRHGAHAMRLHFMYYNYARIHQSLRTTPAMEVGVSDRLWSMDDTGPSAD